MIRTYIDSSVLIAAFRGEPGLAGRAEAVLNDPNCVFLSSDFVRLEVLPKAIFHRQEDEIRFYQQYLSSVIENATVSSDLVSSAYFVATNSNLSALDALHVAAAIVLEADELVTMERSTSPLVRVSALKVISIR